MLHFLFSLLYLYITLSWTILFVCEQEYLLNLNYQYKIFLKFYQDIVGKSGFVSHTKHTAEGTNMDLFHS